MDRFEDCHAITARWEGGWSDHPRDPGGKTNWGITQATLSAYRGRPATADEIRKLTKAEAKQIYAANYWRRVGADQLPPGVDLCIYDFGVNSGPSRAIKSLQAALGLKPDGWVGEITVAAAGRTDARALINKLCDRRLAFLKALPTWDAFGKGWGNRVADIRRQALRMADGARAEPLPPDVPADPAAKALPPPVKERAVSQDQIIGGVIGSGGVLTTLAAFWRDNRELFTDPAFLAVGAVLSGVAVYLLMRRPATVEEGG
jgi:lysozyme family protein